MAGLPPRAGPSLQLAAGWPRGLGVALLALLYFGAARIPLSSGLAFQAYLFWPAAAVAYTAFLFLGKDALWGLALGSLLHNALGWLPWGHALAMSALQTLGPWTAWRLMLRLGCPHPDLRQTRDLLRWLGVATLSSAIFSSGLGTLVVGLALPGGSFSHPLATTFSWFLGDLTAILCLGPVILHFAPRNLPPSVELAPSRRPASLLSKAVVAAACLLLLFGGRINPALSGDFRLGLQFALVLPVLWMALRFGPRDTAAGVALLTLAFLAQLWVGGVQLPDEAFRFSQMHLLVLALAALVTSASAEETRQARLALEARDLQAQRMEAVGTLAGGLVHEFNNQLTVVLGNLDRLRLHLPPAGESLDFARRLEEAALAMGTTVRQLKALSHQAPLRSLPLPLSEALTPFLLLAKDLPARITFHHALDQDPVVGLDPDLLTQALQRLLANSVEAIQGSGHIELKAWLDDASVHLTLEDDGPGMGTEVLHRACDPFFTTKPLATGRGLGLSIAFALTKQLGGHLLLDSQPGQGTRAELVLPLGRTSPTLILPTQEGARTGRILLADDEAGIRALTREFLEGEGYLVSETTDGQEALNAFESDPKAWDLVILDLVMPRVDGAEVLNRIQHLRPELPALLISGYSAAARPGLLDAPHRRFLAKPFRLQELLEALEALGLRAPQTGDHHGQ